MPALSDTAIGSALAPSLIVGVQLLVACTRQHRQRAPRQRLFSISIFLNLILDGLTVWVTNVDEIVQPCTLTTAAAVIARGSANPV
jgi:hypothetical protein